jgi:hypothetical protein
MYLVRLLLLVPGGGYSLFKQDEIAFTRLLSNNLYQEGSLKYENEQNHFINEYEFILIWDSHALSRESTFGSQCCTSYEVRVDLWTCATSWAKAKVR